MSTSAPNPYAGVRYLLVSRGLYWRPLAQGYTGLKRHAGRYERKEAVDRSVWSRGTITVVAEDDAPRFAPKCCQQTRSDELEADLMRLEATLEEFLNLAGISEWGDPVSALMVAYAKLRAENTKLKDAADPLQLVGRDLLITMTVAIDRDGNVHQSTKTHDNPWADVYRGMRGVLDEVTRLVAERRVCPFNPKYGAGVLRADQDSPVARDQ